MAKTYITFGQTHAHSIGGKTFDKDCVAVINCHSSIEGRNLAFEIFGGKFCMEYHENEFNQADMAYYPRGQINVN